MATNAIIEASRFLYLHPIATTDLDNPVELLGDLVSETRQLEKKLREQEDLHKREIALALRSHRCPESDRLDAMIDFVRKLRDDRKICDLELARAMRIAAGTG